jgi:hypothetical protein
MKHQQTLPCMKVLPLSRTFSALQTKFHLLLIRRAIERVGSVQSLGYRTTKDGWSSVSAGRTDNAGMILFLTFIRGSGLRGPRRRRAPPLYRRGC